jgi:hypothetical protein
VFDFEMVANSPSGKSTGRNLCKLLNNCELQFPHNCLSDPQDYGWGDVQFNGHLTGLFQGGLGLAGDDFANL